MNVFLSQDFLTVIHDMKFPGYPHGVPGSIFRFPT